MNFDNCCPRCGKSFSTNANVLNHMNQPVSSCRYVYENTMHFHTQVQSNHAVKSTGTSNDTPTFFPEHFDENNNSMDIDNTPNSPMAESSQSYFREEYPRASGIFGQGNTFMDNFNLNQYSNERKSNLYYPFASEEEWELALFLLRSGLSMASIDQFLKLSLVGLIFLLKDQPTDTAIRFLS